MFAIYRFSPIEPVFIVLMRTITFGSVLNSVIFLCLYPLESLPEIVTHFISRKVREYWIRVNIPTNDVKTNALSWYFMFSINSIKVRIFWFSLNYYRGRLN